MIRQVFPLKSVWKSRRRQRPRFPGKNPQEELLFSPWSLDEVRIILRKEVSKNDFQATHALVFPFSPPQGIPSLLRNKRKYRTTSKARPGGERKRYPFAFARDSFFSLFLAQYCVRSRQEQFQEGKRAPFTATTGNAMPLSLEHTPTASPHGSK